MMATQFSHNSFLYSKYIIRKGNGTFVSSAYLKLQSFFILIPGNEDCPAPLKTIFFNLYTYHSQADAVKKDSHPFSPRQSFLSSQTEFTAVHNSGGKIRIKIRLMTNQQNASLICLQRPLQLLLGIHVKMVRRLV